MMVLRFFYVLALAAALAFVPVLAFAVTDSKASPDEAVASAAPVSVEDGAMPADEHAGEAAAEAGHESGGLPQLNIGTYPSQIFWLMVMFAVLYVAFSKSILPSIGGVVNARDSMIKGNLDAAQDLKKQAEDIQASYEKSLDQARANAVQAVQDVENAAKKKAADQIDEFRRKADGAMKSAEENVLHAKDKAMGDMMAVATDVASVAAEKITGVSTDRQKAQAIVETLAGKAKAA